MRIDADDDTGVDIDTGGVSSWLNGGIVTVKSLAPSRPPQFIDNLYLEMTSFYVFILKNKIIFESHFSSF